MAGLFLKDNESPEKRRQWGERMKSRGPTNERTDGKTEGAHRCNFFFPFCFVSLVAGPQHLTHDDTSCRIWPQRSQFSLPSHVTHQHTGSSSRCLVVGEADRWRTNEGETASGWVLNLILNYTEKVGGGEGRWAEFCSSGMEQALKRHTCTRVPLTRVFTEYM